LACDERLLMCHWRATNDKSTLDERDLRVNNDRIAFCWRVGFMVKPLLNAGKLYWIPLICTVNIMPRRPRKGVRGASATSAAASKKMINAAESKKNTKPLSLAMSSDQDLLLLLL